MAGPLARKFCTEMPPCLPQQPFTDRTHPMIWRAAPILAVLFWAVMSGLLVRDVYFPEASRFATIPPKVVVDRFLRQSETFGSSLHLYHHREKIGHATFQVSRRIKPKQDRQSRWHHHP